jgi:hypothetical protein
MQSSFTKLAYVGLLAGAILVGSMVHVFGGATPTVFSACLSTGGTLTQVTTNPVGSSPCPTGTTAVTWNQQGAPGPAGGLNAIREIDSSTNFVVPPAVSHLLVEAWGGGGGGTPVSQCYAGNGGGSGGYLRSVLAVTPGESLSIVIGAGGGIGLAGSATTVMRGSTLLVSAGGGAGADAVPNGGGAGGQATSSGGLLRTGNPGGNGEPDSMYYGCINNGDPFCCSTAGVGGSPVQGTVQTRAGRGGDGADRADGTGTPGLPGEAILSW